MGVLLVYPTLLARWIVPAVLIYRSTSIAGERKPLWILNGFVFAFAPAVVSSVVLVIATKWRLQTHRRIIGVWTRSDDGGHIKHLLVCTSMDKLSHLQSRTSEEQAVSRCANPFAISHSHAPQVRAG